MNKYNSEILEEMTDEELAGLDLTNAELAEIHLEKAANSAKITLQLAENCFQKFGKQILSDELKKIYRKMANREDLTDEEMEALDNYKVDYDMSSAKQAREDEIKKRDELGEAYEPILLFEDKTEGFPEN